MGVTYYVRLHSNTSIVWFCTTDCSLISYIRKFKIYVRSFVIWQCLICQAAGYLSWNKNDREKRRVGQRYGFHNAGLVNTNLQIAQAKAVGVQVKSAKAQKKTCAAPVAVRSWQTASGAVSGIKVQTQREERKRKSPDLLFAPFSPT